MVTPNEPTARQVIQVTVVVPSKPAKPTHGHLADPGYGGVDGDQLKDGWPMAVFLMGYYLLAVIHGY